MDQSHSSVALVMGTRTPDTILRRIDTRVTQALRNLTPLL